MKKTKNDKKIEKLKYTAKERLLISSLTSLTISFIYILFGSIDIYANNYKEYLFSFSDFILPLLGVFALCFVALTLILWIFKGTILNILSCFIFSVIVWGYVDTGIINKVDFFGGDASSENNLIISLVVFIVLFYIFIIVSMKLGKKWKTAIVYLSILFIAMNAVTLISDFAKNNFIKPANNNISVLSKKDLYTVSEKENVIIFLVDRLDNDYYEGVLERDPEFFNDLDGFTYYNNNISLYPRTFPSVTYMVTGERFDGDKSPVEYLNTAYSESLFLNDLKANGYGVDVYGEPYYEYTDAKYMEDVVDNVEVVTEKTVNKKLILEYLVKLSACRNISFLLMRVSYINQNLGITSRLTTLDSESGKFDCWEDVIYKDLKENGLSFNEYEKNYKYIYLHGSHTPYILNENVEHITEGDVVTQTMASFKVVKDYISELKRLGVYDKTTIIICGDHGLDSSDVSLLTEWEEKGLGTPSTTACLYKPKTSQGTPLKESSAPISEVNVIPTLVEDANIETENDYGISINDIENGATQQREYIQLIYSMSSRKIGLAKFYVGDDSRDSSQWKYVETKQTDFSWY